jgi:tetratricopeptide (TPR) repeat protein
MDQSIFPKPTLICNISHVEATSNLAATLLSLNRREEAERYWLRAVKLRPSYFEAVEHLIGLLCNSHRAKEAVSIIDFVETSLKITRAGNSYRLGDITSEDGSETSQSSSVASEREEWIAYDFDFEDQDPEYRNPWDRNCATYASFGSSGYAVPASENGRMLALVHAKGNMMYALGDNAGAAKAFEDAILIGAGRRVQGVTGLIQRILTVVSTDSNVINVHDTQIPAPKGPVLLPPDKALQTARLLFPHHGCLPGLKEIANDMAKKAAISTTSTSLLSLAKIFQDGMSSNAGASGSPRPTSAVRDILALYYLSLSLQPSPSTANNVGILLASVQQTSISKQNAPSPGTQLPPIPGVVPGSGIALALRYYNYGLNLDSRHAHLYTNLGSLFKDIGQLNAAIKMYEKAVDCDGTFDIALANLANAVKDQGRISDAIGYYKRAVTASPNFPEAVCGLANALNSVCSWKGRGGMLPASNVLDRWHVDENGMLLDSRTGSNGYGWMKRVVDIVDKQLRDGENWGKGALAEDILQALLAQIGRIDIGKRTWKDCSTC